MCGPAFSSDSPVGFAKAAAAAAGRRTRLPRPWLKATPRVRALPCSRPQRDTRDSSGRTTPPAETLEAFCAERPESSGAGRSVVQALGLPGPWKAERAPPPAPPCPGLCAPQSAEGDPSFSPRGDRRTRWNASLNAPWGLRSESVSPAEWGRALASRVTPGLLAASVRLSRTLLLILDGRYLHPEGPAWVALFPQRLVGIH